MEASTCVEDGPVNAMAVPGAGGVVVVGVVNMIIICVVSKA